MSTRLNSLTEGQVIFDLEKGTVCDCRGNMRKEYLMSSEEGFLVASDVWLRAGWDAKYVYSQTWMGRPIIQLPDDLMRLQEMIWKIRPSLIIETGVAHGGGQIFLASLCKAMGLRKVIGVDVEIRKHNRIEIEGHMLYKEGYISLIEGDSVSEEVIRLIKADIDPSDKVMVILDSNHSKNHVLRELEIYSNFVTNDSLILATDGIMSRLKGAPRSGQDWNENNPVAAVKKFLSMNESFEVFAMSPLFNEGVGTCDVTYFPYACLRRIKSSDIR